MSLRRIQRDSVYEEMVKSLTSGDGAVFGEIFRLLLFAAAIGISEGKRTKLGRVESGKAIPEAYFATPGWRGFLHLILIAETGTSECLRSSPDNQEQLVLAFEEYANTGLGILQKRISEAATSLDAVVSLLTDAGKKGVGEPALSDLI